MYVYLFTTGPALLWLGVRRCYYTSNFMSRRTDISVNTKSSFGSIHKMLWGSRVATLNFNQANQESWKAHRVCKNPKISETRLRVFSGLTWETWYFIKWNPTRPRPEFSGSGFFLGSRVLGTQLHTLTWHREKFRGTSDDWYSQKVGGDLPL